MTIIVGVTLTASSITVFFEPNSIVTGGVSGLCIIVAEYLYKWLNIQVPLSVLSLLFNAPLLITGYFVLGKGFIGKTLFAAVYFSAALWFTAYLPVYIGDYIIVSVFGGLIMGVGVGLTMRSYATTGGSDLFGAIVHKIKKHISVANSMFAFDAVVIVLGFLLFGLERGLYAIISVYICSKVVDNTLEGLNFSLCAFIVSPKSDEIADAIINNLNRGVTGLRGTGMFTKSDINVLLCTVGKKEIQRLKKIVDDIDSKAFMIISNVKEALGEGFTTY